MKASAWAEALVSFVRQKPWQEARVDVAQAKWQRGLPTIWGLRTRLGVLFVAWFRSFLAQDSATSEELIPVPIATVPAAMIGVGAEQKLSTQTKDTTTKQPLHQRSLENRR
jgi:hypothetical protein